MIDLNSLTSKQIPLTEFLKNQRENKRFNSSLEVTVTLLVISFFSLFAIKPAVTTISALLGQIKSKELMVQKMRGKINNIVSAQESFAEVQEKYQIIESALPSTPRYSHSAIQVAGIAAESGSQVNNISFSLKTSKVAKLPNINLATYGINLSLNSGFSNALSLIDLLNQNRRLIRINRLTLSAPKETITQDSGYLPGQIVLGIDTDFFYWNPTTHEKN